MTMPIFGSPQMRSDIYMDVNLMPTLAVQIIWILGNIWKNRWTHNLSVQLLTANRYPYWRAVMLKHSCPWKLALFCLYIRPFVILQTFWVQNDRWNEQITPLHPVRGQIGRRNYLYVNSAGIILDQLRSSVQRRNCVFSTGKWMENIVLFWVIWIPL